ncbi:MAG: malonyl-CoA decarboxylase [Pseudomonadota bacterium]
MIASKPLTDLLTTLLDRPTFGWTQGGRHSIREDCLKLLEERAEISGLQLAGKIFGEYAALSPKERIDFFDFLNNDLDIDPVRIAIMAETYRDAPTPEHYRALADAGEPPRQRLFRRLNEAPGATANIVQMREHLRALLEDYPQLARTDYDLQHLLRSWFNRGFLVMQQISWDSPATILEKIIAYEAVHEIQNWDDLRRRLQPEDRRCFAFFHPSMPTEPLIFVEVALTKGVPNSIQTLLDDTGQTLAERAADTAVFYSISNCQPGLAGVSFGNSLIKQVARDLSHDLPNLKTFVTLSPIPGFRQWLESESRTSDTSDGPQMERLAAKYLLTAKDAKNRPQDPVARFHLGNGAQVHALHHDADVSDRGRRQSHGVMVNYLYDMNRISQRAIQFSKSRSIAASADVKALVRRA